MGTGNTFGKKGGSLVVTTSKFTSKMRNYDEECKDICCLASDILGLYNKWKGVDEEGGRNPLLDFIAHQSVGLLKKIRAGFNKREQQICDEHCEWFTEVIQEYAQYSDSIQYFLEDVDVTLQMVCRDEDKSVEFGILRVVSEFKPKFKFFSDWLQFLSEEKNGGWADRVAEKYRDLGLHFHTGMFSVEADGFRQQFYMMLNCLTLLAIPSHSMVTDEEFAELYWRSFEIFRSSSLWKMSQEDYAAMLENDMEKREVNGKEQKIRYLKERWMELKGEKEQFLQSFGIRYCCINSKNRVGALGRQLYERLNWVNISSVEELEVIKQNYIPQKMSNNDLCRYFMLEAKIQFLTEWIEELKKTVECVWPNNDYFFEHVPRDLVHDAMDKTIKEERNGKMLFRMQAHWICFYKVLEYHQLACNNMKSFASLMRDKWFVYASCRCDYDSLKNLRFLELKNTPYTEWEYRNHRIYVYRQIADMFEKYLRENGVIE